MFEFLLDLGGSLWMFILFMLLSICLCIFQIIKRKKYKLRTACKISTFIPLIYSLLMTFWNIYLVLQNLRIANDFPPSILASGLAISLTQILMGLWITIILFIIYSITFTIFDNSRK